MRRLAESPAGPPLAGMLGRRALGVVTATWIAFAPGWPDAVAHAQPPPRPSPFPSALPAVPDPTAVLRQLLEAQSRIPKPEREASDLASAVQRAARIVGAALQLPQYPAKLAELRAIRQAGIYTDLSRCAAGLCLAGAPVCVPDLTRCSQAVPPTCETKCTPQPDVCLPDLTRCSGGAPPKCEQTCTPGPRVCVPKCSGWPPNVSCHEECVQGPDVCVPDTTRCSPAVLPTCEQHCTHQPDKCEPDLTRCGGGTPPRCEQICAAGPTVCLPPDCRAVNPVATGYNPARALSAEGLAELAAKAMTYERVADDHMIGNILLKKTEIDPSSGRLLRSMDYQDAAAHSAPPTAGCTWQRARTSSASPAPPPIWRRRRERCSASTT
jgi:hypothetical protein